MYNGIKFPIPYSLIQAAIGGHLARLQEGGTAGNPSELGSPLSAPPPPAPPVLFPGEEPPEDDPIRISTNLASVREDLEEATKGSSLFSGSIQEKLADAIEERNRNRAEAAAESARIQAGIRARAAEAPTSSPQFLSSGVQGGSTPTGSTTSSLLQKAFLGEISDFLPPVIEARAAANEFIPDSTISPEAKAELEARNEGIPDSTLSPAAAAILFGDQSPSSAGLLEIPVPGFKEPTFIADLPIGDGTPEDLPQPPSSNDFFLNNFQPHIFQGPLRQTLDPNDPLLDVKNNLVGPEGQNLLAQAAADEKISDFDPRLRLPEINVAGSPLDRFKNITNTKQFLEQEGVTSGDPKKVQDALKEQGRPVPGTENVITPSILQIIKGLFSKNTGIQGEPLTAPPGGVQLAQAPSPFNFIKGSSPLPTGTGTTTTPPTTPFIGRLTNPAIAARFDQKSLPILGPGGRNIVPPGGLAFTGVGPSTPEQRQLAALKEAQKTFGQTSLTGGGGPLLTQAQRARTFAKSGGLLRHLTKTQPSHPLLRKV